MIRFDNHDLCEYCFEELDPQTAMTHCCTRQTNPQKFPVALTEGTILKGRYIVGKVLGKGGFGITYLCYDMHSNRKVAIKEYFPSHCCYRNTGEKDVSVLSDQDVYKIGAKKFHEEASLLSTFAGNKGIVEVMSAFRENKTEYFVMEYLSGKDIKTFYNDNAPLDENYVIYIIDQVLKALRVIHSKQVIHRDISPTNVFFTDSGDVKLIDFGASRVVVSGASKTITTILNPGLAPPEQFKKNGNQGPWTDIFALGGTMYYLLKGCLPAPTPMRQTSDTLDMDGISPGLAYILSKMLALRIEMRYQSAQEVLNAIDAYQKGKMTVMTDTYPNDAGVTTVGTNGGTTGGTTGGMTGGSANGTTNSDTKKILIPLLIVLAAVLGISVVLAILLTL